MKRFLAVSALVTVLGLAGGSFAAEKSRKPAAGGSCTIAQVMKTVHQHRGYGRYEYASNYSGEQGAPTLRQNENNDQYLFWIDDNGQTCPAVVTYESGKCAGGTAVVRMDECQ